MKVLVATASVEALSHLQGCSGLSVQPVLYADQVAEALAAKDAPQLIILDWSDVVLDSYPVQRLKERVSQLQQSGAVCLSSQEFLAQPDRYLKAARESARDADANLPLGRQCLAFVSYSGGTGRTTLALDTALHFARRTKRPVLLAEFTYGISALRVITGLKLPSLYDLATQLVEVPAHWQGVSLVPMDYENCQDLSVQLFGQYLKRQIAAHDLTVVDSTWPHGLLSAIAGEVNRWLVVTTPRSDALANARRLKAELGDKATVILNRHERANGLDLAGLGEPWELPPLGRAARFDGELGKRILAQVYGVANWRGYESSNLLANLGFGSGARGVVH
jgi:Mrp family chromosome partitioning ATPase